MKTNYIKKAVCTISGTIIVLSCLLLFFTGCTKVVNLGDLPPTSHTNILNYKASPHHIFVGFLVGDGNDPFGGYNPANSPDSIDFLEFFAGVDTVRADWRVAQAKGTRIVECHFMNNAYFDGSVKDPATLVAGYVNPVGFSQTKSTATSSYSHWAKDMYSQIVINEKLDGIDMDIESGTFGGDVATTNGDSLLTAVARYFGPNSTLGTVAPGAKKPVFFFDTDGTASTELAMYTPHKSNYDYVLFQSYTTGSHAWRGTGTVSFAPLVATYGLEKLIFLVNGDSFLHPDGGEDVAGGNVKASADLISFATWVRDNNGVGVGAYRMSRDYNHTPPFAVSKQAIQIMNPAKH